MYRTQGGLVACWALSRMWSRVEEPAGAHPLACRVTAEALSNLEQQPLWVDSGRSKGALTHKFLSLSLG